MNRRDREHNRYFNRNQSIDPKKFELNPIPSKNSKMYQEWLKTQQPQKSNQQIAKELQVTAGKLLATANKLMKT